MFASDFRIAVEMLGFHSASALRARQFLGSPAILGLLYRCQFPLLLDFFFFKLKFKLPFSLKIEIIFVNLKFAVAFWSIRGKFIYILETQELIIGA